MVKIAVLGSGSAGNCTYLDTGKVRVLVDLGFGIRSLKRRLRQAGLETERIDAILLTHGHGDHVKGVAALAHSQSIPVYLNQGTRQELAEPADFPCLQTFRTGSPFAIGDLEVEAFEVSHDSREPVGFSFSTAGLRGALATDLGEIGPSVTRALAGCDWLILESNHDEEMLKVGPYPWVLKQRVLSRTGHLSNQRLAHFLRSDFDGRAAHIFLAHLSRQNNHPELALESARDALSSRLPLWSLSSTRLHLTHQGKPSIVLTL